MKRSEKILLNILSGVVLAVGGFIVGSRIETKEIKDIYEQAKAKIDELNDLRAELSDHEEKVNIKYSFCRCIAQNMKENGYKINFMPAHSLDIEPAVEHEYAYSVAITAIGDSDMDPYHKDQSIMGLKREQDVEYYKGVIAVADNHNMRSVDKMQTILGLS